MQVDLLTDIADDQPLSCTICILQEARSIPGTIRGFYPHHCEIETQDPLTPGMTVSLTLRVAGTATPIMLAMGGVTWARATECGIAFPYSSMWTILNRGHAEAMSPATTQLGS